MTPGYVFIVEQLGQALQQAEARIAYLEQALKDAVEKMPARPAEPDITPGRRVSFTDPSPHTTTMD